ncbi:MAG: MerR family DNA-binding transcriptional regulator [Rhodospirillales bacterium]|nr:MAG: MerR family DNA-binding transcriptional regulator [Rhodospirillales bacterium]
MEASNHPELYSVTELAADLGVTARTLRFYEDKGLIEPRRIGNTRVYTHRDRGRLILILRGKRLGFSLREIRDWLELYEAGPGQRQQMDALIAKAAARLATLQQQREDIDATIAELKSIMKAAKHWLADQNRTSQHTRKARQ